MRQLVYHELRSVEVWAIEHTRCHGWFMLLGWRPPARKHAARQVPANPISSIQSVLANLSELHRGPRFEFIRYEFPDASLQAQQKISQTERRKPVIDKFPRIFRDNDRGLPNANLWMLEQAAS